MQGKPQTAMLKSRRSTRRPLSQGSPMKRSKRKCRSAQTVRGGQSSVPGGSPVHSKFPTAIDIATNELRAFYSLQRSELKTEGENRVIKERLDRYHTFTNRSRKSEVQFTVTHKDMVDKFEDFKSKINSLLSIHMEIKDLGTQAKEYDTLKAGLQKTYRIPVRAKQNPLKIRLEIIHGAPIGKMYLSEHIQRPNKANCTKEFPIASKTNYAIYKTEHEKDKCFVSEYIFLTLEVTRDISFEIDYTFGKTATFNNKLEQHGKTKSVVKLRTSKLTIDEQIKMIVGDKALLKECRRQAEAILKKRKERYERLTGCASFVDKNKNFPLRLQSPRPNTRVGFEIRRRIISARNDEREEERRMQIFLHAHRWDINKRYEDLINKAVMERKRMKSVISTWAGLIKLGYIGKYTVKEYEKHKKRRMEMEKRLFLGVRIYISYISRVKEYGPDFKDRISQRMSA